MRKAYRKISFVMELIKSCVMSFLRSESTELDSDKLTLDSFQPRTKEDFTQFSELLKTKFNELEGSPHYFYFLSSVVSNAVLPREYQGWTVLSQQYSVFRRFFLVIPRQKYYVNRLRLNIIFACCPIEPTFKTEVRNLCFTINTLDCATWVRGTSYQELST